MLKYKVFQRV